MNSDLSRANCSLFETGSRPGLASSPCLPVPPKSWNYRCHHHTWLYKLFLRNWVDKEPLTSLPGSGSPACPASCDIFTGRRVFGSLQTSAAGAGGWPPPASEALSLDFKHWWVGHGRTYFWYHLALERQRQSIEFKGSLVLIASSGQPGLHGETMSFFFFNSWYIPLLLFKQTWNYTY